MTDAASSPSKLRALSMRGSQVQSPFPGTSVVTVRIFEGDDDKSTHFDFVVHEKLLREQSPFFAKALDGPWIESQDRVVRIHNTKKGVFEIFFTWLYSTRIWSVKEGGAEIKLLVNCYIFGELVQSDDFKDCVMDAQLERSEEVSEGFKPAHTKVIWDNTPDGSCLRRTCVDYAVYGKRYFDTKYDSGYPLEFTLEALRELTEKVNDLEKDRTSKVCPHLREDRCQYHEHRRSGKSCYKERLWAWQEPEKTKAKK